MKKNELYTAEITAVTSEGNGVCKINGMVVFVPYTAVGDEIELRIVKVLKNFCFGKAERILSPSSARCIPSCSSFPQCGGCIYRHLSYHAELEVKQQVVRDAFQRIGKIQKEPLPILGSEQTDFYRNKVQLPVGTDENGKLTVGYYAARSHRLVPMKHCFLQPQIFTDILSDLTEYLNQHGLSAYDEKTYSGTIRHFYLRRAEQTGQVMAAVIATKPDDCMHELPDFLVSRHPEIKSLFWNINPDDTNVVLGKKSILLYGSPVITDKLCGKDFELSLHSFYQVNRRQAERLYHLAAELSGCGPQDTLVDLYCGVGTIGLSMADHVKRIIGVEIVPQAIENAKRNARINGIQNADFHCGDAKSVTAMLRAEHQSADIVILDPPRKGCEQEVLNDVCAMNPKRVVMISCNPATAARDCRFLEDSGYQVASYRAVDLFPRTMHVECVTLLQKTEGGQE